MSVISKHKNALTIKRDIVKGMLKGDQDKLYEFIHTNIEKGASNEDLLDFAVDLLMDSKYPIKYFKEFCSELGVANINIKIEIPEKRVGEA